MTRRHFLIRKEGEEVTFIESNSVGGGEWFIREKFVTISIRKKKPCYIGELQYYIENFPDSEHVSPICTVEADTEEELFKKVAEACKRK